MSTHWQLDEALEALALGCAKCDIERRRAYTEGYRAGEIERVALATANGELRSELLEMKRIAISNRAQAAKSHAAVERGNAMIHDLQAQLAEHGWTPAG